VHVDAFFNDLEKRRGNVDVTVGVLAAALDQQDLVGGILGEAGRQHASGGTSSDDDEVESRHCVLLLCRELALVSRTPFARW
jgi:hypothetical protein